MELKIIAICLFSYAVLIHCDFLEEVFRWKQLSFEVEKSNNGDIAFQDEFGLTSQSSKNETFLRYDALPFGVSHYKNRLFITVARRRPGIPSTLNVIDLSQEHKKEPSSPKLKAYPDALTNTLNQDYVADSKRIVSVYRTKVDKCGRLWFVDTGTLEYPNNRRIVQRPSIWAINIEKNQKVIRFEIPQDIVEDGVGMASLAIDVEANACDDAYAYVPDLVQNQLNVFSLKLKKMWSFSHNTFRYDPAVQAFNVAGNQFNWDDGIFSIAVGRKTQGNAKIVYYHPMVSNFEFYTSSETLKSELVAKSKNYSLSFQSFGQRGPNTQSTMHEFDDKTGTLFFAEVNRNSIGCWNSSMPFTEKNQGIVHLDYQKFIYPSDLSLDNEGNLWVLTNSLPIWIYSQLDTNEYNFRVWKQSTQNAIAGTICQ